MLSTPGTQSPGDASTSIGGAAATIELAGSARMQAATSAAPEQPAFCTTRVPVFSASACVVGCSQSRGFPDRITRLKSRLTIGCEARKHASVAPAENPYNVMLLGSPPKPLIFCATQSSAAI